MLNKKLIFHFKNYEINPKDNFIFDLDLLLHLNSNDNVIK